MFDPSRPENLDENGQLLAKDWLEKCLPYSMSAIFKEKGVEYFSQPEDQAKIFLFLASDDSKFITGEEIIAAGGMVQR